jgi:hypothetical protein
MEQDRHMCAPAYVYTELGKINRQYLSGALVRARCIVFRHYYRSLAKSAGKDFRDGAVVPFE